MIKNIYRIQLFSFTILLALGTFLSTPLLVSAAGGAIGDVCTQDTDCSTNTCEQKEGTSTSYCVCNAAIGKEAEGATQCSNRYSSIDPNPGSWQCEQGIGGSYNLNYCQNSVTDQSQAPAGTTGGSSWYEYITDTTAAVQFDAEELQKILAKPSPRITIPGLNFTDVDKLTRTNDTDGNTYMYFPFLSEYISAWYKYLIIAAAVLSIIMIIAAGFQWVTSAGSSDRVSAAKNRIIHACIGLFLAVSSYTLLYTINPELVNFRNLKVLVVEGTPISEIPDASYMDGSGGEFANSNPNAYPTGPSAETSSSSCQTTPSVSSGIGDTSQLGKLDCHTSQERKLTDIKNIIIHDGGRSVEVTVNQWKSSCKDPSQGCVASHYFIDRNGKIFQLMDEKKVAYHTPGWNTASIGIDLATVGPVDRTTKSCLICKKTGSCTTYSGKPLKDTKTDKQTAIDQCRKGFTPDQYTALSGLINSILGRIGQPKNTSTILGHCNSAGNHGDPVGFEWTKIGLTTPSPASHCYFNPSYEEQLLKDADEIFGA